MRLATITGETFGITVSIGLATLNDPDQSLHHLLDRADQSLYSAKRSGRDRLAINVLPEEPSASSDSKL